MDPSYWVVLLMIQMMLMAKNPCVGWSKCYPPYLPNCQKITVPLCRGNTSKYDRTRLPNFFGYSSQYQVQLFTEQSIIQTLVNNKCSRDIVFFLCAVLLPICVNPNDKDDPSCRPIIPPCRSLCEIIYNDCAPSLRRFNETWPVQLNCSSLPYRNEGMCIDPTAFVSTKKGKK